MPSSAIYYPAWNAPKEWLRSALLFYDTAGVLCPEDYEISFSPDIASLRKAAPDAFDDIVERDFSVHISTEGERVLANALDQIAEDRLEGATTQQGQPLPEQPILSRSSVLWMHAASLGDQFPQLLHERGLAGPDFDPKGFLNVDNEAALLLLSVLSGQNAKRRGKQSLSYQPFGFAVNSLLDIHSQPGYDAKQTLASAIISLEIPATVGQLSVPNYLRLREQFAPIRGPFHKFVSELTREECLEGIDDQEKLRAKIDAIGGDLWSSVEGLRKSTKAREFIRWAPFAVGSVVAIGGAILDNDIMKWTGVASSVSLGLHGTVTASTRTPPDNEGTYTKHLLADLRSDLLTPDLLRKLVIHGR